MPTRLNEKRLHRTYSLLPRTEQMISEIASRTIRGKAHVIDMAIAELYQRIIADESEGASNPIVESSQIR